MANPNQSYGSGEPGSSGRELFEGSTATGHGEKESTYGTGYKEGTEAGDRGNHGEHDHDLGAGPHKRSGSGAHQSSGLGGDDHTRGVAGGHSGSGTGDLSGRPADISSALKVPHEEHALHGAGIQSIGGANISGNHNPRSLNEEGLQGQSVGHRRDSKEGAGVAGVAANEATHGHSSDSGRHGLTNQFDHSEDKALAGARHEADLPTHGQINKDAMNPSKLFNKAAGKADQKADENDVKGGSTTQEKAERAANQKNL